MLGTDLIFSETPESLQQRVTSIWYDWSLEPKFIPLAVSSKKIAFKQVQLQPKATTWLVGIRFFKYINTWHTQSNNHLLVNSNNTWNSLISWILHTGRLWAKAQVDYLTTKYCYNTFGQFKRTVLTDDTSIVLFLKFFFVNCASQPLQRSQVSLLSSFIVTVHTFDLVYFNSDSIFVIISQSVCSFCMLLVWCQQCIVKGNLFVQWEESVSIIQVNARQCVFCFRVALVCSQWV